MRFNLLFEQSGTFKNVLKDKGYIAYDYDILNDYGQTDFQIDLFQEIENEYSNIMTGGGTKTIFSEMTKEEDFIIAFFPCTHFCDANELQYRLWIGGKKVDFDKRAVERLIARNKERARYFELYLKFTFICQYKGIKTIIENPASSGNKNYLVQFSPIPVGYHEADRSVWGDYFKKPTNFFSINFEMQEEFTMYTPVDKRIVVYKDTSGCRERSEISSLYAENFYKRFIRRLVWERN